MATHQEACTTQRALAVNAHACGAGSGRWVNSPLTAGRARIGGRPRTAMAHSPARNMAAAVRVSNNGSLQPPWASALGVLCAIIDCVALASLRLFVPHSQSAFTSRPSAKRARTASGLPSPSAVQFDTEVVCASLLEQAVSAVATNGAAALWESPGDRMRDCPPSLPGSRPPAGPASAVPIRAGRVRCACGRDSGTLEVT